jgi:hypothetical protein
LLSLPEHCDFWILKGPVKGWQEELQAEKGFEERPPEKMVIADIFSLPTQSALGYFECNLLS